MDGSEIPPQSPTPPPAQAPPPPPPPAAYPPQAATSTGNPMAVAGFVCGLVGLILFWIPVLGLIIAGVGLVFGILGKLHADKHGVGNGGLAIAGAILGGLGVAAGILFIVAIVNTAQDSSGIINQIQTCLQTPSAPGC